jgi:hypothetical protein
MKRLSMIICFLPLSLFSVERALAQAQATSPVAQSTPTTESDKAAYIKFQAAEVTFWRQKISDFDARAETSATEAGQAAKLELATAWSALEGSSTRLSAASSADWDRAKTAYESARQALETKWAKFDAAKT